jgi:hypothetical protein
MNPSRRVSGRGEREEQVVTWAVAWMSDVDALICTCKRQILEAVVDSNGLL